MSARCVLVGLIVAAAAALAAPSTPRAGRTLTHVESPADLSGGRAEGIAVTRSGRLFLAPRLERVERSETAAGRIWAVTADRSGNLFIGTGPDGRILRVDPSDREIAYAAVGEPMVTALAVASDGALLAGTAGGAIYRIRRGEAELWSDTGERYVWSLAVTADGAVFAGTGDRGRILEIGAAGDAEVLFDSDEPHIVSLLAPGDGDLLAGGAGRGLVYRVDREGHALVLYDDELSEVVALGAENDGGMIVATMAPVASEARPPALRLRLPDGVRVGSTEPALGALDDGSGPTLRGVIEGLPPSGPAADARLRGKLARVHADGRAELLWSSVDEAPFCVRTEDDGRVLFGTGEPARLYRVEGTGDVALLATLREAQVTGIHAAGRRVHVATSNPAAVYRVEERPADTGLFVSRPLDAGGPSRWGSIRWSVERPSGRTEFYTRTGNSRVPDRTWSAWSPTLVDPDGSTIVNPDGRYLQWRVRQVGGHAAGTRVSDVTVLYEPYNRPPELRGLTRRASDAPTDAPTFDWKVRDPDGDALEITLEFRARSSPQWDLAVVERDAGAATDPGPWREGSASWATGEITEGEYELRAIASDRASNAPGEALTSAPTAPLRVRVDRTPPVLELSRLDDGAIEVRVTDAHSDVAALFVLTDGDPRYRPRPLDGVADAPVEVYRLDPPDGPGVWSLRGIDAAGNRTERPFEGSDP